MHSIFASMNSGIGILGRPLLHPPAKSGTVACAGRRICRQHIDVTALLHDTVEDLEGLSIGMINEHFGSDIAAIVEAVTR